MTAVRGVAWRRAGLVLALVLLVDQATKLLVRANLEVGDRDPVLPGVKLVYVENRGVAFGAFSGSGQEIVLVIVAIALVALVVYFMTHSDRPGIALATGLLLGGAIGNIIDRIALGAVTDFVKLPAWPAFNVADVAITAGVVALLIVVEKDGRDEEDERQEPPEPGRVGDGVSVGDGA